MAVQDHFLKIDGIEGESPDSKHKNEIQIMSFSFGAAQTGTSSSGGGAGKGRVKLQDFVITKAIDKASPKLFQGCCSGEIFKSALLTVRKAGKDQQEYFTVKMTDVLISSHVTGGDLLDIGSASTGGGGGKATHDDWAPIEEVKFNFSKIEMGYKEQKADGTLGGEIKGGWNIKENVKT